MAEQSLFDQAWVKWRQDVTADLAPEAGNVPPAVRGALERAGAFAADGLIDQNWALGLMSAEGEQAAALKSHGLTAAEITALSTLVQRHPTPAAGG